MQKSGILLWVNLVVFLFSCKHENIEQNQPELKMIFSRVSCYESDSVWIDLFVNNQPYTGDVQWNNPTITLLGNSYLYVAPVIHADSTEIPITATLKEKTVSQTIGIVKHAFKNPPVRYQNTIQPILTNNCNFSGCHGNGSRAGRITLETYDSILLSVVPYNAPSSLLFNALIKTNPMRIMPPAGKLHDYKIEEVRIWIEQGAQNN
jgi:hypothetical protein